MHSRRDVIRYLRNYEAILRDSTLFPELSPVSPSTGLPEFVGLQGFRFFADLTVYIYVGKCFRVHRWCTNMVFGLNAAFLQELLSSGKALSATFEHDINVWYTDKVYPRLYFDAGGFPTWYQALEVTWNNNA